MFLLTNFETPDWHQNTHKHQADSWLDAAILRFLYKSIFSMCHVAGDACNLKPSGVFNQIVLLVTSRWRWISTLDNAGNKTSTKPHVNFDLVFVFTI